MNEKLNKELESQVQNFRNLITEYCCLESVAAQSYIKLIKTATGVPVKWIGVGSEREATIRR